jgi:hypothetical protein
MKEGEGKSASREVIVIAVSDARNEIDKLLRGKYQVGQSPTLEDYHLYVHRLIHKPVHQDFPKLLALLMSVVVATDIELTESP